MPTQVAFHALSLWTGSVRSIESSGVQILVNLIAAHAKITEKLPQFLILFCHSTRSLLDLGGCRHALQLTFSKTGLEVLNVFLLSSP